MTGMHGFSAGAGQNGSSWRISTAEDGRDMCCDMGCAGDEKSDFSRGGLL